MISDDFFNELPCTGCSQTKGYHLVFLLKIKSKYTVEGGEEILFYFDLTIFVAKILICDILIVNQINL